MCGFRIPELVFRPSHDRPFYKVYKMGVPIVKSNRKLVFAFYVAMAMFAF